MQDATPIVAHLAAVQAEIEATTWRLAELRSERLSDVLALRALGWIDRDIAQSAGVSRQLVEKLRRSAG